MQDQKQDSKDKESDGDHVLELGNFETVNEELEVQASNEDHSSMKVNELQLAKVVETHSVANDTSDAFSRLANHESCNKVEKVQDKEKDTNVSFGEFRNAEDTSSSLIQMEEQQELGPSNENKGESEETVKESSSKSSLWMEIGNLRVKGLVGRPKKQTRKKKNPFDFANLGIKKGCKKASSGRLRKGPYKFTTRKSLRKMGTIQEDQITSKEEQAKGILQSAEEFGLHVNGERSEAIKMLVRELEEGTL